MQNLLKGVTDTVGQTARAVKGSMSGSEDDMAKKMFINKFVSRASEALNTAVQQKLVNPSITKLSGAGSAPSTPPPTQTSTTTPSAPATGGAPAPAAGSTTTTAAPTAGGTPPVTATQPAGNAPGNVAVPTGGKQGQPNTGIDVSVKQISRRMNQLQPTGTKPIPKKAAQEIATDLPKVSLNKDYLVRVGGKILKLNDAGYDVKDMHKQFLDQYVKGTRQKTIQESIEESRLEELYHRLTSAEKFRNALKKTGYDPELAISRIGALLAKRRKMASQRDELIDIDDLREVSPQGGGKVAGQLSNSPNAIRKRNARLAARTAAQQQTTAPQQQQPATQQTTAPQQQQPATQQTTAPQQQQTTQQAAPPTAPTATKPGKPSMGQWLKDNFIKNFFKGVPWQSAEPQIDKILMRLPKSYKDGTIQKDLQDIASIGWSLSPKKD